MVEQTNISSTNQICKFNHQLNEKIQAWIINAWQQLDEKMHTKDVKRQRVSHGLYQLKLLP